MTRLLVTLVLFGLTTVAPGRPSASPGNILLARGRTEPTVAVDPRSPSTVVVSANTDYSAPLGDTLPTAYFASHDGGGSFVAGPAPVLRPYTTEADTTVRIASDGTVFYGYLGETPSYCSGGSSAVLLTHSTDGGRSFKAARAVDGNPDDDKPNMAVESVSGHPAHIFFTWTRWHSSSSDIWFSRSLDGGVTFSKPVRLWSSSLDNYGTVPIVGPHHRVYVFWAAFPETSLSASPPTSIFMRSSIDDGATFGQRVQIGTTFRGVPRMEQPEQLRVLTLTAAAVDARGAVYAAWPAASRQFADGHVDADLLVSRSTDGGRSWSPPHRVNDVRRGDRFMPAMAVLADGTLGLAFYDRRAHPGELDVYAARVSFSHGFRVSSSVRINRSASSVYDITYIAPGSTCFSPGRFFGDYIGVAAQGSRLATVWADTQLHVSGETDIWFASVSLPGIR